MKINKKIIIITLGIICSIVFFARFTKAEKNIDIINTLVTEAKAEPIEYGVRIEFVTDKKPEEICDDILKKFNPYGEWETDIVKNEKIYCVEFKKNNLSGYIETIQYEKNNIIKMNVIKKDKKNDLENLKQQLKIISNGNNIKCYEYLRAKILNDSIEGVNNKLLKTLKKYDSKNVNITSIRNGYSVTSYTGFSENRIYSNNKYVDLNYAICKYSSGVYLIIGTPEITETY